MIELKTKEELINFIQGVEDPYLYLTIEKRSFYNFKKG